MASEHIFAEYAMALYRISDRHPDYREIYFQGNEVKGLPVYTANGQQVGDVYELLVDDDDYIQQLIINAEGTKVRVPANRCSKPEPSGRISLRDINRDDLMKFDTYVGHSDEVPNEEHSALNSSPSGFGLNEQHSEQSGVRWESTVNKSPVSQSPVSQSARVEDSVPVDGISPLTATNGYDTTSVSDRPSLEQPELQRDSSYSQPSKNLPIQLYEEQLVTSKQRIKTGEVKISKRTVVEESHNQIPVTREKVVIEIESIYGGETRVNFGDAKVSEDGSVQMDIYEEQAQVCRRVVPYQSIAVRKELIEDVVEIEQTVRREELSVDATAPYVEVQRGA